MAITKLDVTRQAVFSGDTAIGAHKLTGLLDPTLAQDAATKSYVDAVAQGINAKYAARAATTGAETFTVASGTVTQIAGTVVDGVSPAVNDYVLIKDAPAATGVGSVNSSQPGNGLYQVTSNTTNLSLARANDMSGAVNLPAGAYTFVEAGTTNASAGYIVSVPSTNTGFVYGTNNIQWQQFTGAGEVTTGNVLTKTGNQISVSAMATNTIIAGNAGTPTITTLSGDLTIGATGVTAIGANRVTLGQLATLAANSVIGNSTGSTATPTAVSMLSTATASAVAIRDANANVRFNNSVQNIATTVTAAATTTLVVGSARAQQFTGTTTQTVVLPDATTLSTGHDFYIANRSTGAVQVNASGGGALQTLAAGTSAVFTLVTNGTAAGTWDTNYSVSSSGTVTSVSVVSANGLAGTVATPGTTPAITLSTTITGLLKGNGTAISAAVSGTDYLVPANFADKETPTGLVNGANTTYTLAFTPTAGSEHVYLNGILQESGAGNDYTIATNTITYLAAPITGDKIRVTYRK